MSGRSFGKSLARGAALIWVLPRLLVYALARQVLGPDRALQGAMQSLSKIPGIRGEYVRRAFLMRTIDSCHPDTIVGFGSVLSRTGARIAQDAYVGLHCQLGLVTLEPGVLIADRVQIPSGGRVHGTEDLDVPIREQEGRLTRVTIGTGTWIGTGAIVMADVGAHCIVAAGAVVTHPVPDYVIVGGVPARILKQRRAEGSGANPQLRPA